MAQLCLDQFSPEKIQKRESLEENETKVKQFLQDRSSRWIFETLRKDCHPQLSFAGDGTWLFEFLRECSRRGEQILHDLGWPADASAQYVNLYVGSVELLKDIMDRPHNQDDNAEGIAQMSFEGVWSVIEHWEPFDCSKPNEFRIRYLRREIESFQRQISDDKSPSEKRRAKRQLQESRAELERELKLKTGDTHADA